MLSEPSFAVVDFPLIRDGDGTAHKRKDAAEQAGARAQVQGHAAGFAAGLRAAQAEADERLASLEAAGAARLASREAHLGEVVATAELVLQAVHRVVTPTLEQSDETLIHAAIELAEAVIGHELSQHEAAAAAALRRILHELAGEATRTDVILRLHPDDAEVLREARSLPDSFDVRSDATLARGDAIAELPDGLIDARIGTALARAKLALLNESPQ